MKRDCSYTLASNRVPKLDCPFCGSKKHWQRYYNPVTGYVLPEKYGRCDNEDKCGMALNPYTDGYFKILQVNKPEHHHRSDMRVGRLKQLPSIKKNDTVLFPPDVFKLTLRGYEQNVFIQNLLYRVAYPFNSADIEKVIAMYYLGTVCNGYRTGAITFPYIDINGGVRTIQVKQFDETNNTVSTDFLHSIIEKYHLKRNRPIPDWLVSYKKQNIYISCLFGEHLLSKYPLAPIVLVEAPKTAIYGTLYFGFPEFDNNYIWLAVYNKSSFTLDKIRVLQGRDVYVFPDLSEDGSTFNQWQHKARSFEKQLPGTKFILYDYLEKAATDDLKKKGGDLADVLIEKNWVEFRNFQGIKQAVSEIIDGSGNGDLQICENCEKSEPEKNIFFTQDEVLHACQDSGEELNTSGGFLPKVNENQIATDGADKSNTSFISGNKEMKYQTLGQVFDLMKARGYKTLPNNMKIIVPGLND